jgi:hypothetical protein
MTVLHQMGHASANLVREVAGFEGAIVSPVNSSPAEVSAHVAEFQNPQFRFVFDPQMYFPRTARGKTTTWSYYPADFDTADASEDWWFDVGRNVIAAAQELNITHVCTPVNVPNVFSDDFYRATAEVSNRLCTAAGQGVSLSQTVLVRLDELAERDRAMAIASIVSNTSCRDVYLVICSDLEPRREYVHTEALKGAMRLIAALSASGIEVTVPFCGSEVVLWKAAGAKHCATGKFFNLRRFTPGRWEDPNEGGGQVPYWFEESLMALIRQSDLLRLRERNLFPLAAANFHGDQILELLAAGLGQPWVGHGWRQFMAWFASVNQRIEAGLSVAQMLIDAEEHWAQLGEARPPLLMEEPRNDGRWIRPWRIALTEYGSDV